MTDTEDQKAAGAEELTTPGEHAEAAESVEPGGHVSSPDVPNDVEIAARSADMDEPSNTHEKQFVLGPNPYADGNPYTVKSGYDHEPNKLATRQYAIDAGLWPTGDVELKSTKRHPDGVSWILTYTVDVIPAHIATDGTEHPTVTGHSEAELDEDGEPTGETVISDPVNATAPAAGEDGEATE